MINYHIIFAAEKYYQSLGYKLIESPWVVGKNAYYATKPSFARDVCCSISPQYADDILQGFLPASGEQSLLHLIYKGKKIDKVVTTTPCFRVEEYDEFHQPWFLKTELMVVSDTIIHEAIIPHALEFYRQYLPVRVVSTEEGHDIVGYNSGIELGSYGIRYTNLTYHKQIRWAYGTGVAEPRLSQVIEIEKDLAQ